MSPRANRKKKCWLCFERLNSLSNQDGSGSTLYLANSGGALLEWYRYDLQGTPIFYDAKNNQLSASNYSVRHLFTGQQWYSQLGLYDLRNRFYSPDIGRFLQPDPIGFAGDPTNLYRYCGNNPVIYSDPTGEIPAVALAVLAGAGRGFAIGAGVDLTIQYFSKGRSWSNITWSQVGINGAAGALTGGISGGVQLATALGSVGRVAINTASSGSANAAAQAANNAAQGKPLSSGVPTAGVWGAGAGLLGGIVTDWKGDVGGVAGGLARATAFAFENSPALQDIFSPGANIPPSNPFEPHIELSLTTGRGGLGFGGGLGGFGGFGGGLGGNSLGNFGGFGSGVRITSELLREWHGWGEIGPGPMIGYGPGGGLGFPPWDLTQDGPVKKEF
jgi:RHS repeat-associated protein